MAASKSPLVCFLFSSLFLPMLGATSFRPKALVLPVTKHPLSLQHVTQIQQRTPLVPVKLTVDLGGKFTWVDCALGYVSSTYKPARCGSAQCNRATEPGSCGQCLVPGPPRPGCNNNTCGLFPENTVIGVASSGELASDVVSVSSANGFNPTRSVTIPNFQFVCATTFLLEGLAGGATGMAGFGRNPISIPSQFAAAFSFNRKFAICLSTSSKHPGVIFAGNAPYHFLPNADLTHSLTYTPLLINPVSNAGITFAGEKSAEYFIAVKSIRIAAKSVPLNATLLQIDATGGGGAKISTVHPYTVMESSIYTAVLKTFTAAVGNVSKAAAAVAPFGACFRAEGFSGTRVGPGVPWIDLELEGKDVIWRMFGGNSMVRVNDDVLCLGFVDGGSNTRTSIVIGAHQIEEHLLEFDLATSKFGFSSTLLGHRTNCANFNFTL